LIRSWNVYHGRTHPPGRRAHLSDAIRLVTADSPDVVCLQEVPAWGLTNLAAWSGMQSFVAITKRAPLGSRVGQVVTDTHHRILRSAVSGQGNAILVSVPLAAEEIGAIRISGRAGEPRICHAVRLVSGVVVANLHASARGLIVIEPELARALEWLNERVAPDEPLVLAGDFNTRPDLPGFSPPGPGIDHVLVRGAEAGPLLVWPEERRRQNGRLLSDHAPVELEIEE
jgi:endonuclease/exonuclease/phosphatase family metal-dependent hydrolase